MAEQGICHVGPQWISFTCDFVNLNQKLELSKLPCILVSVTTNRLSGSLAHRLTTYDKTTHLWPLAHPPWQLPQPHMSPQYHRSLGRIATLAQEHSPTYQASPTDLTLLHTITHLLAHSKLKKNTAQPQNIAVASCCRRHTTGDITATYSAKQVTTCRI